MEAWASVSINSDPMIGRSYSAAYRVRDDVLGTVPARGTASRSTLIYRGRVIYDTTYTIGPDGLRIEPPVATTAAQGCVLFFGDSVTFGEGLHDDETMPYRVALEMGSAWRVYNYSFHGYGAQHDARGTRAWPRRRGAAVRAHARDLRGDHRPFGASRRTVRLVAKLAAIRVAERRLGRAEGSLQRRRAKCAGRLTALARRDRVSARQGVQAGMAGKAESTCGRSDVHCPGPESSSRRRSWWGASIPVRKRFDVLLWSSRVDPRTYQSMRAALTQAGIRYHLVDEILPGFPAAICVLRDRPRRNAPECKGRRDHRRLRGDEDPAPDRRVATLGRPWTRTRSVRSGSVVRHRPGPTPGHEAGCGAVR